MFDRFRFDRIVDPQRFDRLKAARFGLDRLRSERYGLTRLNDLDQAARQALDRYLRPGPAIGPDGRPEVSISRRRLLAAVPGAAGALLLTGASTEAVAQPATHEPRAVAIPRPRKPHPAETTPAAITPLVVQKRPIYTLGDYRRAVPGPAFPTDAVALTIDDGPHPVWTPKILRLLDKYHVPALFCMIGNQVLGHEDVARSVSRDGHQLANHTWSHPTTLAHKTPAQIRLEIHKSQEKIDHTTGYAPKLFRSPGGAWSPAIMREAARAGLVPLDWSDDPRDWSKPGTAVVTKKLLAARPGQILLCHDGGGDRSETYAALSTVIPALTARGYRFVALT